MNENCIKKKVSLIISVLLLFISSFSYSSAIEFDLNAKSAILIDAGTGKVLYEKNSNKKLPPASVTKIMTMLLAMEAIDKNHITLEDKVTISERAASMGGSQLYFEPGEQKSVKQLLKGIAVASANDACVALAEHIAGTEEVFVKKMNEKAAELGMNNTQFMNTNGLPQEGHYTSAKDIAIMSRELLKYPKIHEWLKIWMSSMKVGKKGRATLELVNTNKLIKTYPGANGIKTGFTQEARYCLSASATRNNFSLIAVVLGCPTSKIRFAEAKKLLDYGFASYNSVSISKKGEIFKEVIVEKGKVDKINIIAKDELKVLVKKGEESKIKKEIVLPKTIKAPFEKGQKVGEIIVKNLNGKEMGKVDLITESKCKKASIFDTFVKILKIVPK
ncbi:D-alanyl-D-alanine carboxypeptidase family protein [Paramaledivibacter caminithermalis]|uniref:serine-type D-Ala-D-Ala carboxypeptidase n=1 Tax=Paramaledivibacter caminithermalis (strain DSM 15212 / CIP 107654 / DViRD3) TaxID=1121301 RepID=A0A1M6JP30_PARC5|nr:D-alanyl-D-alanine carboxypeptidase family protein [Paramaledivibacter caminithermalis]SHJ48434.1 D-alanyl-D-alanine carboxypeptidase (penicillin-binding protein 5/6) [Paramaledivibacter caminithermalis DSM 15212]